GIGQSPTGRVVLSPNFAVDDAMIADFLQFLKSNNRVKVDEAAFAKDKEFIRAMIRYRIDETLFGRAEALRRLIPADPQAQVAMTSFGEAEKLPGIGKNQIRAH